MKKRPIFLGLLVFLLGVNLLVWGLFAYERAYANKIYPGVWYANQSLAKLTREQARQVLEPINQQTLDKKISLVLNDTTYDPTLSELGYSIDTERMVDDAFRFGRERNIQKVLSSLFNNKKIKSVELAYTVDQTKLDTYLTSINKKLATEPKDMSLDYKNGVLSIVPYQEGVNLNTAEFSKAIASQIKPGQNHRVTFTLEKQSPLITQPSQVAAAKATLEQLLQEPLLVQAADLTFEVPPTTTYTFVVYQIKDNQLAVTFDQTKLQTHVAGLAQKIDIRPVTKRISTAGGVILDEGRDGRKINQADSTKLILDRLERTDFATPVVLPVEAIERKVVTEEPEYQLGRVEGKYIDVSLKAQKMYLIEGTTVVNAFRISTGKWNTPTPKGEFFIYNHVETAYSKLYKLYMPYWMALKPVDGPYRGYGIHGLPFWKIGDRIVVEGKSHIGRQVSHGCIRLGAGDEQIAYHWAQDHTTRVYIHD